MCVYIYAATAKSLQSCPTLCDPIDGRPPGSAIPGILQARTLEWVAISFCNAWKWKVKVKSLSHIQLLATPWTAGSSVHGIFQARVLEWDAIAFSIDPFSPWESRRTQESRLPSFPSGSDCKSLPAMQETQVWSLNQEDPLKKGITTHSSILAWRIPRTEEPGGPLAVHGIAENQTWLSD